MAVATKIIGVGNPLMGDDGVGIAVVERLAARSLPQGVEVIDGGGGGLALLDLMAGAQTVILIDAAEMGLAPGAVARFTAGEILPQEGGAGLSLHQAGLAEVFALGRVMGLLPPRVVIFGVQPGSVAPRIGLSPAVETVLEGVAEEVLAEARQAPTA